MRELAEVANLDLKTRSSFTQKGMISPEVVRVMRLIRITEMTGIPLGTLLKEEPWINEAMMRGLGILKPVI